ncbi:glutathione S-transferase family protein [Altererythrobacter sp. Root672]|uniref:glutathione S-transferase family protein n=1 Tax=Altererythrobacter sp. Root672 TaxID=1736584 RepID=UPI0006F999F4|nr:glutathione S-transferase family protein [Altererythrobacter sp. Root672]KRA82939.1 glutathionyl-hydroquinone reductase YqjG [Altererythrobacter sp. Root672]
MAQLVDGKWMDTLPAAEEIGADGRFRRIDSPLREWISVDPAAEFPAEAGRYHLWVAAVCPWAARTTAFRVLKGLEQVITVSFARPGFPKEGWVFDEGPDGPVEGGYPLHRLYTEHDPSFTGKVTVPTLWDKKQRRIVNNESSEIIRMLNSAFDEITRNRLDFYPEALRDQIEQWNALIYPGLNNGVYRTGFASTQAAYDEGVREVFATLDAMEDHLSRHRYLAGEYLTEADWRAFTSLVRFDVGYHGAFKCNLRRIEDYPALRGYLRELYQWPGIAGTVDLELIKFGYWFLTERNHIVAIGPELDLATPHDRDRLPGKGVWQAGG